MHGNFPALAQHLFGEPDTVVTPGLTNFNNPFLAIHVYGDFAMGITKADGRDGTGDFKFLVRCPILLSRMHRCNRSSTFLFL